MLRKDVKPGQCFRFLISSWASYYVGLGAPYSPPPPMPEGWCITWGNPGSKAEVELLEHYSTHPVATPIKEGSISDTNWDLAFAEQIMRDNDLRGKKATIGKLTDKESKAWSAALRTKIEQQEAKVKKDKEIKVALEFDYWE